MIAQKSIRAKNKTNWNISILHAFFCCFYGFLLVYEAHMKSMESWNHHFSFAAYD